MKPVRLLLLLLLLAAALTARGLNRDRAQPSPPPGEHFYRQNDKGDWVPVWPEDIKTGDRAMVLTAEGDGEEFKVCGATVHVTNKGIVKHVVMGSQVGFKGTDFWNSFGKEEPLPSNNRKPSQGARPPAPAQHLYRQNDRELWVPVWPEDLKSGDRVVALTASIDKDSNDKDMFCMITEAWLVTKKGVVKRPMGGGGATVKDRWKDDRNEP